MHFVSSKEAREYFSITANTLKVWKDQGRIRYRRFSPKKILYDIDSVNSFYDSSIDSRKNIIYARVSCSSQKKSLDNQIELIKNYCISNGIIIDEVYSEIASGLNDNRKELNRLLKDIQDNKVKKVFISFKDRLTRFGFNYFKTVFSNHNTEIVVLDSNEQTSRDYQQELVEDLVSIIHHYSIKLYSNRRKEIKNIEETLSSFKEDSDI